jgi:hypothetical protein
MAGNYYNWLTVSNNLVLKGSTFVLHDCGACNPVSSYLICLTVPSPTLLLV